MIRLTCDFEVRDTCHLSGLIPSSTFVYSLVFWESPGNVQRVYAIARVHLEILGWLDQLVVVIPLDHWV